MKRMISILLAVILVLTMVGCQTVEETKHTDPPGSNGPSKPASKEPPILNILDSTCIGIEAYKGTYTWTYDNGDGTQSGVCADSSHPLEWQEFLIPMTTVDDTVELNFAVEPQEFIVRCWSDAFWGQVDAKEENVTLTGNTLELKDGGYIYEVVAKWTGENLAAKGTVYYAFYVIKDTHIHMIAEVPQTVDDPVTGYCGNTITKILIDGKAYSFMGSDSVNLTDILINLKYDPNRICRCMAEFQVETESGTTYGVNLSQGYARCEDGQADLTEAQIELIKGILDSQA